MHTAWACYPCPLTGQWWEGELTFSCKRLMIFCQSPMKFCDDHYSSTIALAFPPRNTSDSTRGDKQCFTCFSLCDFMDEALWCRIKTFWRSPWLWTLECQVEQQASLQGTTPCQKWGLCLIDLFIPTCVFASGALQTSVHSPNASFERRKTHRMFINLFLWCLAFWHFLPLLSHDDADRETVGTLCPVTAIANTVPGLLWLSN